VYSSLKPFFPDGPKIGDSCRIEREAFARLSVAGKLPGGYVILCRTSGAEYNFLAKTLGISVECPHCGATRGGADLAQEYFLGRERLPGPPELWPRSRATLAPLYPQRRVGTRPAQTCTPTSEWSVSATP
jgi:hypothetical protein